MSNQLYEILQGFNSKLANLNTLKNFWIASSEAVTFQRRLPFRLSQHFTMIWAKTALNDEVSMFNSGMSKKPRYNKN